MPSWRSAVKRRSKSGCKSGVHTGARRRATREGCCASPRVKGRSTDGYLWAAVNSERQLRSAAQRQHAAERVGAEGQRRAQRKEAAERTKQEKAKTELELGQQPTCPHAHSLSLYEEAQHDMRIHCSSAYGLKIYCIGGAASVAERYASQARALWAAAKTAFASASARDLRF